MWLRHRVQGSGSVLFYLYTTVDGDIYAMQLRFPETYFQAAFHVQTPWTMRNPDGTDPNRVEILKEECYIFDFAPTRALRQVADYSCRLNMKMDNPEKKVEEFISFLPVLAYDGSSMRQIDAAGILDMVTSGTSATLLARRWESALLVNVDNDTLRRLMNNHEAMKALMSIEGFRSLNQDLQTIINKSEAVTKARKEKGEKDMTDKEKKVLTTEEKEYKSLRKQIQEKLIKFATRIPIFLYLTDYRENCLRDVITKLEPDLFRKVTGLLVEDFELLVSLGVFNAELMNDAIYKFRRYEDASLEYTGINRHRGEHVGLFDTASPLRSMLGVVMERVPMPMGRCLWRRGSEENKCLLTSLSHCSIIYFLQFTTIPEHRHGVERIGLLGGVLGHFWDIFFADVAKGLGDAHLLVHPFNPFDELQRRGRIV